MTARKKGREPDRSCPRCHGTGEYLVSKCPHGRVLAHRTGPVLCPGAVWGKCRH